MFVQPCELSHPINENEFSTLKLSFILPFCLKREGLVLCMVEVWKIYAVDFKRKPFNNLYLTCASMKKCCIWYRKRKKR